jgi:hypothetical protein
MSVAPPIYAPRAQVARLTLGARLLAVGVAGGCLAMLVAAVIVRPDPSGVGSHHQLHVGQKHLERCAWLERTGVPCPTCGMTTSFAHFVRGNFVASFYVQPMGFVLAVLTAMTVWGGLYIAFTGRPAHRLLRFVPSRYYLAPLFTLAVLAWAWKIAIHLTGHDGW